MHIKCSCAPLRAVLLCTGAGCFSLLLPALQSNILDLVRTQQEQSVRVAEACKAAADARADGAELETMLAWLTAAHAQEMALHQAFQSEVGWLAVQPSLGCLQAAGSPMPLPCPAFC